VRQKEWEELWREKAELHRMLAAEQSVEKEKNRKRASEQFWGKKDIELRRPRRGFTWE